MQRLHGEYMSGTVVDITHTDTNTPIAWLEVEGINYGPVNQQSYGNYLPVNAYQLRLGRQLKFGERITLLVDLDEPSPAYKEPEIILEG